MIDKIKLSCLVNYLISMLEATSNLDYGRGFAHVSCLLTRLCAIMHIPADIFVKKIKQDPAGRSLLEAAGILRLYMAAEACAILPSPGEGEQLHMTFTDSRFKASIMQRSELCIKSMPIFLTETCKKEITGLTKQDPW